MHTISSGLTITLLNHMMKEESGVEEHSGLHLASHYSLSIINHCSQRQPYDLSLRNKIVHKACLAFFFFFCIVRLSGC